MTSPLDIVALADALIERSRTATTTKIASAPAATPGEDASDLVVLLKQAAAVLRAASASDASLNDLLKVAQAAQRGTGAQNPAAGGVSGGGQAAPTLGGLQTTGLGATAGVGGVLPAAKTASAARSVVSEELRKIAAVIRTEGLSEEREKRASVELALGVRTGLEILKSRLMPQGASS